MDSSEGGSGGHHGRLTKLVLGALAAAGLVATVLGGYTTYVYLTQPAVAVQRAAPGAPTTVAPGVPAPPPGLVLPVPTTPPPSPPAAIQKPAARQGTWLEIPDLGVFLPIEVGKLEGSVPYWKALVYPGKPWPGQPGNSYLYAHGIWGEFGGLLWAKAGEPVYVRDYSTHKVNVFHISRVVGKVAWNDAAWLQVTSAQPLLTMQTCMSYNPHGNLWIVQAR